MQTGDADYLAAFHTVIIPILRSYSPDLIIVSSGFDAANGDPLGQFAVTPDGYAAMTRELLQVAGDGRVVVALEGGYNLSAISKSAEVPSFFDGYV